MTSLILDSNIYSYLTLMTFLFSLLYLIQLYIYRILSKTSLLFTSEGHSEIDTGVSVIICAHNESDNLKNNLRAILDQKYADFEVIVVNDRSTDESDKVINELKKTYNDLKCVNIKHLNQDLKGKRNALIQGVNLASKDMLLLTDADCKPASKYWIRDMMHKSDSQTEIILGHAPFYKKKGFWQYLFRFDNSYTAIKYFSAYKLGMPYMGVGRNIAITKELFINNIDAYKNHKTASGDDDLLVNAFAMKNNTRICTSSNTFMYSDASTDLRDYFNRKRRHLSAGAYYKRIHLFGLGLVFLNPIILNIFFIGYFCWSILNMDMNCLIIISSLFLFKNLVQYIIYNKLFTLFDNKTPIGLLPVLDLLYFLLTLVIIISLKINSNIKWK